MEGQRATDKSGKRKNLVNIGGGGGGGSIGGLFVLGGALAVTSLITLAAFVKKKNGRKDANIKGEYGHEVSKEVDLEERNNTKSEKEESNNGHDSCCRSYDETLKMSTNQADGSSDFVSTPSLMLEAKLVPKTNDEEKSSSYHQEIVLSDVSVPESVTSLDDNGGVEECLEPIFGNPYSESDQNKDKTTEYQEEQEQPSMEIKGMEKDDQNQFLKELEFENDDEETAELENIEYGEGSSESTERTSVDSTEEAVWPAELIEEPKQETLEAKNKLPQNPLKEEGFEESGENGKRVKFVKYHGGSDSDMNKSLLESDHVGDKGSSSMLNKLLNEEGKQYVELELNDQPLRLSKLRIWIASMLMLTVILLVFAMTRGTPSSSNIVDNNSSSYASSSSSSVKVT